MSWANVDHLPTAVAKRIFRHTGGFIDVSKRNRMRRAGFGKMVFDIYIYMLCYILTYSHIAKAKRGPPFLTKNLQ